MAVVLSSRSKPEMEELFKRTIPHESRFGTRFVFREVGCSLSHACVLWYQASLAHAKPCALIRAGEPAHSG